MTGTPAPRTAGHTVRDILATARRPGAAEPTEIHVRSEIHARMLQEVMGVGPPVSVGEQREITQLDGIPLVVDDDTLPAFPGYEIHRDVASGAGVAAA